MKKIIWCVIIVFVGIFSFGSYMEYYDDQVKLQNAKNFIGLLPSESFKIVAKGSECVNNGWCPDSFILFEVSDTVAHRLEKRYTYEKPDHHHRSDIFLFLRLEDGYYHKEYRYSKDSSVMCATLIGKWIYYKDSPDFGPSLVDE